MKIDSKKLIFVHIPRTGGTTVEYICGVHSRVQGAKNLSKMWWGGNTQHYKVNTMIQKLGKEKFDKYYSFSIIRNPYDRLISIYKRFNKIQGNNKWTFDYFVNRFLGKGNGGDIGIHLTPQHKYICINDKIMVSKIFHTENFKEIYDFLKTRGFDKNTIKLTTGRVHNVVGQNGNINKSNSSNDGKIDTMKYFNEETLKKVNNFYKKDFEIFGYNIIANL